jgi:hypothetical protein
MKNDNTLIENAVRPIAFERNNSLLSGSRDDAEMNAVAYSFMARCYKINISELEWLKDVFERIQDINQKGPYPLLPSNWKSTVSGKTF